VLVFALLVVVIFRRFRPRPADAGEARESLWSEADLLHDLLGGLRRLRPRRRAADHRGDAPIARLFFDLLLDAETRGTLRGPGRTPLQIAPALSRLYGTPVPEEIAARFSALRYAGRDSDAALVARLRATWEQARQARN